MHKKTDQDLRIWSHLRKKSLMENFIFYAVKVIRNTKKEIRNWAFFMKLQMPLIHYLTFILKICTV